MGTAPAAPELGSNVPLQDVELELSRQMRIMHGQGEAPVQRVRMSNLVVYCDKEEQVLLMMARLSDVTAVHPARVLLLVSEGRPDSGLTAAVTVEPHRLGNNEQACSELVVLRAPAHLVECLGDDSPRIAHQPDFSRAFELDDGWRLRLLPAASLGPAHQTR